MDKCFFDYLQGNIILVYFEFMFIFLIKYKLIRYVFIFIIIIFLFFRIIINNYWKFVWFKGSQMIQNDIKFFVQSFFEDIDFFENNIQEKKREKFVVNLIYVYFFVFIKFIVGFISLVYINVYF